MTGWDAAAGTPAEGSSGSCGPECEQALGRLFQECIRLHIIVGDCNTGAMVYTESRGVQPEFVLVDGLGEKNLIPLRTMSWRYNRRKLLKAQTRILREIAAKMPHLIPSIPTR